MKKEPTLEELFAQLDETVRSLSDSDTSLETALSLYADAAKKLRICSEKLNHAELRIAEIDQTILQEVPHETE